jgi:hypothetical protein
MAALRPEDLDFISSFDTVWAVVLGAVLATLGGFAATQMERIVGRQERERSAALLFGEVLATLAVILELAGETHGRGDPYGPVTMRLLRSARREMDIYERNRERLFDLRDGELRARIHTAMVRLSVPFDGVFDTTREVAELENRVLAAGMSSTETDARRAMLCERREAAFEFALEAAAQLQPFIVQLEPLARHSFQGLGEIARGG